MRAFVVGGGIAGPVTAMALHKAGIEALLVEAHARTDGEVGSYFTVSPNGLDGLAVIDALDGRGGPWVPHPSQRHAQRRRRHPRRPAARRTRWPMARPP